MEALGKIRILTTDVDITKLMVVVVLLSQVFFLPWCFSS
jgi:hypothetical protein